MGAFFVKVHFHRTSSRCHLRDGVRLEEEDNLGEASTSVTRHHAEFASEHDQREFLPARDARSTRLLALKNPQVLAQKEDLKILVMVGAVAQPDEVKKQGDRVREKKEEHSLGLLQGSCRAARFPAEMDQVRSVEKAL